MDIQSPDLPADSPWKLSQIFRGLLPGDEGRCAPNPAVGTEVFSRGVPYLWANHLGGLIVPSTHALDLGKVQVENIVRLLQRRLESYFSLQNELEILGKVFYL